MNVEQFVGGTMITGALIGLLVAFWAKIKALFWRATSLLVVRAVLDREAAEAVGSYLWKHYKKSRFGERSYKGALRYVKPAERCLAIAWESLGSDVSIFWRGWIPVAADMAQRANNGIWEGNAKTHLSFIRGTLDVDTLLIEALKELNARRHGSELKRFAIHRMNGFRRVTPRTQATPVGEGSMAGVSSGPPEVVNETEGGRRYIGWNEDDIGYTGPADPLGPLAFPPQVDALIAEANRWLKSEQWFKKRRVPWRMGWLLYGPPGTGKSSLAKAIAVEADLPLFAFDLGSMDDSDFVRAWEKAQSNTPCMVLLEDIDGVFKGRENRTTGDADASSALSFSCLLNCISGVDQADGVLLVVTTNKIEDIDEALGVPDGQGRSTRPGRLDRAIMLGLMDEDCRRKVAKRILEDCPDAIEEVVRAGDGDTGAQFQDRCAKLALERFWNPQKAETLAAPQRCLEPFPIHSCMVGR